MPHKRSRKRLKYRRPLLTMHQVLEWADAFHARHRRWPSLHDGRVRESPAETWFNISQALRLGLRGLSPGGSSLARLLTRHRGVRNRKELPPFTVAQILKWAD